MENYRSKLNEIDKNMLDIFIERLKVVEEIGKYKKNHNIKILDQQRENEIISKGLSKIENPDYREYYKKFIELLMDISKDIQSK